MNVVIFGATGLIGQGVLKVALDSPEVSSVLSVGRSRMEISHPKLQQTDHADFEEFEPISDQLTGFDACFWCLGTASAGLDEATYTRITYNYTIAAAKVLREQSPEICFCFVSGASTDSSETGRAMWARVKGRTENALKESGFRAVYLFRPGFIKPLPGVKPRSLLYRVLYPVALIFYPLLRRFGAATSSTEIGQAMIASAAGRSAKQVLESCDINQVATL